MDIGRWDAKARLATATSKVDYNRKCWWETAVSSTIRPLPRFGGIFVLTLTETTV